MNYNKYIKSIDFSKKYLNAIFFDFDELNYIYHAQKIKSRVIKFNFYGFRLYKRKLNE